MKLVEVMPGEWANADRVERVSALGSQCRIQLSGEWETWRLRAEEMVNLLGAHPERLASQHLAYDIAMQIAQRIVDADPTDTPGNIRMFSPESLVAFAIEVLDECGAMGETAEISEAPGPEAESGWVMVCPGCDTATDLAEGLLPICVACNMGTRLKEIPGQ